MSVTITIDWQKDRFAVTCPYWANELVKNLPSRRWSKAKRVWHVPVVRASVMALMALRTIEGVQFTPEADAAAMDYLNTLERRVRVEKAGGKFPSWYKFKSELRRVDGKGADSYPPYKHALRVLDKKWGKNAFALHHDMGTAKTRTEIDYACALRMEGKINAMLVMVKLSGRRNWKEQLVGPMSIGGVMYGEGWAPIPVDVFLPVTDERREFERWLDRSHDFKVMVVGLESLSQGRMPELVERFLLRMGRVFGVIDESHLIANHSSIRSEQCYKFRPMCEFRDTATGTPISKAPLDLYGQFEWLDPEIIGIGDFYAFRNRYAVVVEQKTKSGSKFPLIVGYQNLDELTKLVAPYADEVRKKDVLELPPKNYLPHVYCQMTKAQADLYKQAKDEGAYSLKRMKEEHVIKNVLELELRLHQIAQGWLPTYIEDHYTGRKGDDRIKRTATWHPLIPPARNPKIVELIDLCRIDRQFIIWCTYRPVLEAIVGALTDAYPKESIVQIHGGVSESDRALFRNQYQQGQHKFMIGNTATGGTADTWTACETMVYFDNSNRMIDRAQSEDRAHRGGQSHAVDYVDLVMEKTVDVARMKSIEMKINLSDFIRSSIQRAGVKGAEAILDGDI